MQLHSRGVQLHVLLLCHCGKVRRQCGVAGARQLGGKLCRRFKQSHANTLWLKRRVGCAANVARHEAGRGPVAHSALVRVHASRVGGRVTQ